MFYDRRNEMEKKFIGVPEGDLGKVILSLSLAEKVSGIPATKKEVELLLAKKDIELTDKVKEEINIRLPYIDLD